MTCSIEGCDNPIKSRGWCIRHYQRWLRHGDPLGGRKSPGLSKEEILRYYLPERSDSPNECWEWQGYTKHGYGYARHNSEEMEAHRMAYEVYVGPIPEGEVIRHSCHNPSCCNPNHLSTGTKGDNSQDMVQSGRSMKGTRNGNAILTEDDVLSIRARYASGVSKQKLAEEYGVHRTTINLVINRKNWGWL